MLRLDLVLLLLAAPAAMAWMPREAKELAAMHDAGERARGATSRALLAFLDSASPSLSDGPSPPSLPSTFYSRRAVQNITYKGVNYLQQISYSESAAHERRLSKNGRKLPFAPKSYVSTPYEWLNKSSVKKGTLKGLILNGEPLLQSLSGETFHSMWEWVAHASFEGSGHVVLNQTCDLWTLRAGKTLLQVYINSKNDAPVYFYELIPGMLEQSFTFFDFTPNVEMLDVWNTYTRRDFTDPPLCPKAGFGVDTTTFYIFHPAGEQPYASTQYWGDATGDTFFTCSDLLSNRPASTDHNYSLISSYTVEYFAQYGQYANCNGYPSACVGANDFYVGHEAAFGLYYADGPSDLPPGGQCTQNPSSASGFSSRRRAVRERHAVPGDGTCTWRATRIKTIDSKCLFEEHHFEALCRKEARAPFSSAVGAFEKAFASDDAQAGGCPNIL